MRFSLLVVVIALAGCGSEGGGGPVRTLGANLSNAPTSTWTCADGFPIQINSSFPQPFTNQGNASCTLINFLPPVSPAPGSGVALRGSVRVGPVTGPMRFVRMRQLAQQGFGVQCCSLEEYGRQFTPEANAVTTVPLDMRFTQETDPVSGIITSDVIGFEVLAPNVPVPGFWSNNGGQDITVADYIFLPSLTQRGQQAPSNFLIENVGFSGFVLLINVDYAED